MLHKSGDQLASRMPAAGVFAEPLAHTQGLGLHRTGATGGSGGCRSRRGEQGQVSRPGGWLHVILKGPGKGPKRHRLCGLGPQVSRHPWLNRSVYEKRKRREGTHAAPRGATRGSRALSRLVFWCSGT